MPLSRLCSASVSSDWAVIMPLAYLLGGRKDTWLECSLLYKGKDQICCLWSHSLCYLLSCPQLAWRPQKVVRGLKVLPLDVDIYVEIKYFAHCNLGSQPQVTFWQFPSNVNGASLRYSWWLFPSCKISFLWDSQDIDIITRTYPIMDF